MGISGGGVHQGWVSAISKRPVAESVECRSGKSYRSGSVHGEIELGRQAFFLMALIACTFGAFPVFVVDGSPSHLKSQARIARFFRSSGIG